MSNLGGGGAPEPDWSKLPPELLRLISSRVAEIGDYVRFGAVCKPWFSAASPAANLPPQIPWLLLPYNPDHTLRHFFSPSSRRTYRFHLPSWRDHVICSCLNGWLLMADASFSLSLFNPITKAHIQLPSLPASLSDLYDFFLNARDQFAFTTYSHIDPRTQLLTMPDTIHCYPFKSAGGECVVALVLAGSLFMYCRVMDKSWITPGTESESLIDTVTYHGGRFYIVYKSGDVAACELHPDAKPTLIPSLTMPLNFSSCYLVEVAGVLLCLVDNEEERLHFDCFKLDAAGRPKWSKIQDIGERALFVTPKNIMAAAVGKGSRCRRNCIYYCDAHGTSPVQRLYVISVEHGNVQQMANLKVEYGPDQLHPIWFMPTLS